MYYLSFLASSLIALTSFAGTQNHSCFIIKTTQFFNKQTGKSLFHKGSSSRVAVSKEAHEDPYELQVSSDKGLNMGIFLFDSGSLLATDDGDVIQAHINFEQFGKKEYLGLISSMKSPMARSHRFFTSENKNTLEMVNIHLQCELSK